jgi:hypothetical protein
MAADLLNAHLKFSFILKTAFNSVHYLWLKEAPYNNINRECSKIKYLSQYY